MEGTDAGLQGKRREEVALQYNILQEGNCCYCIAIAFNNYKHDPILSAYEAHASTASLINPSFFTVGIQAQPLIIIRDFTLFYE